jgi:hypothetical protein
MFGSILVAYKHMLKVYGSSEKWLISVYLLQYALLCFIASSEIHGSSGSCD